MSYILILFAVFPNGAQAAVRIGFDTPKTCSAAATEVTAKLQQDHPGAKITWSCVPQ